jgi:hypothetical protein
MDNTIWNGHLDVIKCCYLNIEVRAFSIRSRLCRFSQHTDILRFWIQKS